MVRSPDARDSVGGRSDPYPTGAVVPLVNQCAAESLSGSTFSPLSADIPDPIVVEVVRDMRLGVKVAFQSLE